MEKTTGHNQKEYFEECLENIGPITLKVKQIIKNVIIYLFTFVTFLSYFDVINNMKARNVEKPPFSTAGPMFMSVFPTLSFRSPSSVVMK